MDFRHFTNMYMTTYFPNSAVFQYIVTAFYWRLPGKLESTFELSPFLFNLVESFYTDVFNLILQIDSAVSLSAFRRCLTNNKKLNSSVCNSHSFTCTVNSYLN